MGNSKNPLVFLLQKMWTYSKGNRRSVFLFVTLSIIANALLALEPLIVGKFLNVLQAEGVNKSSLPHLFFILGLLPALEIGFGLFMGRPGFWKEETRFL